MPQLPRSGARLVELGMKLYRSGKQAQSRFLDGLARQSHPDLVFPLEALADRLASAPPLAGASLLEVILRANVEAHGGEPVAERVALALDKLRSARRELRRRALFAAAVRALAAADPALAIRFGEEQLPAMRGAWPARVVAHTQADAGAIHRPLELLERHQRWAGPATRRRLTRLRAQAALLERGYPYPARGARSWQPASSRHVLYYVSQSLPHHSSGYAIRTHWLLRHLSELEWAVTGVARFGYPNDRYDFIGKPTAPRSAQVDGVEYLFAPDVGGFRALDDRAYVRRATSELVAQAGRLRPALIHAASNYLVGLAGTAAARQLGLPSIYEVRGLWHLTRTAKQPEYADSEHYRMTEHLEVQAAKSADHVFVITQAILDLLADRGVERSRMTLLPNAVDVEQFAPRPRDERLAAELGLDRLPVIGFIGSFARYEGLDLLLEAAAMMRRELGDAFRVLLVGDGAATPDLEAQRRALGLERAVIMTGRVPHDRVGAYYSLIDIAAYPRTAARVCQLVSPLKPLEAMAMEKAVVVSDVKALAEMVQPERTGLVHPAGDAAGLAAQLGRLVAAPELWREMGRSARAWVAANRSWRSIASTVQAVYRDILGA